jgi:hypothetical protein
VQKRKHNENRMRKERITGNEEKKGNEKEGQRNKW